MFKYQFWWKLSNIKVVEEDRRLQLQKVPWMWHLVVSLYTDGEFKIRKFRRFSKSVFNIHVQFSLGISLHFISFHSILALIL